MSAIKISNLEAAGLSLFNDQESYLNELNDAELGTINGGGTPAIWATASSVECATFIASGIVSLAGGIGAILSWR